ncbi:Ubiquitin carboxyl-terminal hydrolase family protein [Rhynchospora pubera]|uniref:Ubiquitin carboxyl-terminal hydrolase family protein n=1 Tax=Rhynchospora pubera TaxID=906938 RepID=A0AAV8F0T4_9POAL|nr:Ubiquitin carboxyl-terminal hydrolase family protein [Rhynchospora pubera]
MALRRSSSFSHHLLRRLSLPSIPSHPYSKSTSLPKKPERVRDHSLDAIMDIHKKLRVVLSLRDLLLPFASLQLSRLSTMARRSLSIPPADLCRFLLRHPHVFHIFEHPVQRLLFVRLTPRAVSQLNSESLALTNSVQSTILRLRKLLLLTTPLLRIRLEHIRLFRYDLGLPDDFEQSVILANPGLFRLVCKPDSDSARTKYVEFLPSDSDPPDMRMPAIERSRERDYRVSGAEAEDSRFAFPIRFPPGFKIGKYFRIAVWKWQRLPYWSPYEDISGYDLRSLEAQRRLEKRSVAMIHEILSLTVGKRTTLERIALFKQAMGLPKKMKEFLLQHQGIFYVSTRGNRGKLHTVFLREAYFKGDLVDANEIYHARKKLEELILLSPKKANLERMLTSMGREGIETGFIGKERFEESDGEDSGSDSGVDTQYFE